VILAIVIRPTNRSTPDIDTGSIPSPDGHQKVTSSRSQIVNPEGGADKADPLGLAQK